MDESHYVLRTITNVNETTLLFKTPEDTKYFYIAIASLVVFFLISIITTVLLCVILKNEPVLWETDCEKPPEFGEAPIEELQETSIGGTLGFEDENKI